MIQVHLSTLVGLAVLLLVLVLTHRWGLYIVSLAVLAWFIYFYIW